MSDRVWAWTGRLRSWESDRGESYRLFGLQSFVASWFSALVAELRPLSKPDPRPPAAPVHGAVRGGCLWQAVLTASCLVLGSDTIMDVNA